MYRGSAAGNAVLTTGQNLTLSWSSPFLGSIVVDAVPYGERLYVGGMVTTPQLTPAPASAMLRTLPNS